MSVSSVEPRPRPNKPSFIPVPPGPLSDRAEPHMVRMRDGVRLATDVYLPEGNGPVPVVLSRMPYDKSGEMVRVDVISKAYTERGYAFVAQDTRGKFRSEGDTVPWVHEATDGYDTIDWIVGQPWSNGRVGMEGLSYVGYTQWAALSTNHPALRAIAPRGTNTNLGAGHLTPGEPEWAFHFLYQIDFYADNDGWERQGPYDWSYRPLITVFEDVVDQLGHRPPAMEAFLSTQAPLGRFPEGDPLEAKPIPVLLSQGWYDLYTTASALRDYRRLATDPVWQTFTHLRLGPHDHDDVRLEDVPRKPGEMPGPEQILDWLELELQFFDRYLKQNASVAALAPVQYQLAHSEEVRVADAWPPSQAAPRMLHLTPGTEGQAHLLASEPVSRSATLKWVHNPDNLVPTAHEWWSLFLTEYPDYRQTATRADVLAFKSAPYTHSLELAGPVTFHATVQTTGPMMDLFASLLDVEPDGALRFIARGQLRCAAPSPTPIDLSLGDAGYLLRDAHSLMLLVCGSDYPDFIPLTGTHERWWFATSWAGLSAGRGRMEIRRDAFSRCIVESGRSRLFPCQDAGHNPTAEARWV
jgi:predicted acyl esterase